MSSPYKFILDDEENPTKVIVLTKYAGRPVRGIAKCSPNDTFNETTGRDLAQLRCDIKVAKLRMKRAQKKYAEAAEAWRCMDEHLADMEDYYFNSRAEYENLLAEEKEMLERL